VVFRDKYSEDDIEKVIRDISKKDSARVFFYPAVDIRFLEEYDLSSIDIIRILREGTVVRCSVAPTKTELKVSVKFNFRNSSAFELSCWMDLKDNIHLADINIIQEV